MRMVAVVVIAALATAGCADDDGNAGTNGDLATMCEQMASIEGPEDITVERLDQLLDVAVDEVEEPIRFIRDRLAEDGEAAFEDEAVGERFEQIAAFEAEECTTN